MKRAFQHKVKSVSSLGDIDRVKEKPSQPEPHRRVRTSAAVLGLAISMGASSLLMPRQHDRAMAVEPGNLDSPPATTSEASETTVLSSQPEVESHLAIAANPTDTPKYVVQAGQTVIEIARETQVDAETLAALNGLTLSSDLQAGQVLKLPLQKLEAQAAPTATKSAVDPAVQTEVPSSQTLASSQRDEQAELLDQMRQRREQLKESLAQLRQEAIAKAHSANQPETAAAQRSSSGEVIAYYPLVESATGEISPPVPLIATNPATANSLEAAKPLPLSPAWQRASQTPPETPISSFSTPGEGLSLYQVQPGDTIDSIARSHGITKEDLIQANQLSHPDRLNVNQVLKVPPSLTQQTAVVALTPKLNAPEPASVSASEEPSTALLNPTQPLPSATAANSVTNPASESLRTEIEQLRQKYRAQNLEVAPETSQPAVTVASTLPSQVTPLPETVLHRVEPGDTLNAIAQRYNTSRAAIIKINHLANPNLIQVDQVLKIPQTQTTSSNQPLTTVIPEITRSSTREVATVALNEPVPVLPAIANPAILSTSARPSKAVPVTLAQQISESESAATHSNESKDYIQGLMNDLNRMRQKYQTSENSSSTSLPTAMLTETQPSRSRVPNVAIPSAPQIVNPEFNPDRYTQRVQADLRQTQVARSPQVAQPSSERTANLPSIPAARTQPQQVAVAPARPETYNPAFQIPLNRVVAPELPPLAPSDRYLPQGAPAFNGYIWPSKGVLTSGYGWRWGRMHRGIDIAGPVGTPIVAAAGGVVDYAGWNEGGYGNLVDIRHPDGSLTRYAHNNRILVRVGQQVEQGQQIAEMGNTGFSTGPHLHFEIHPAGQGAVNPIAFLPR